MGDAKSSVSGTGPTPTKQPSIEDRMAQVEKALTLLASAKKGKKGKKGKKKKKEALEEVKGILMPGNLISQMQGIRDELSRLIIIKEGEAETEGDGERPENVRKLSRLRGAYGILSDAQNELSDMYD